MTSSAGISVPTETRQFHLYQSNTDIHHKNMGGLESLLQSPDVRKDCDAMGIHGRKIWEPRMKRAPFILY